MAWWHGPSEGAPHHDASDAATAPAAAPVSWRGGLVRGILTPVRPC